MYNNSSVNNSSDPLWFNNNSDPLWFNNNSDPLWFNNNSDPLWFNNNSDPLWFNNNSDPLWFNNNSDPLWFNNNSDPLWFNNNSDPLRFDNNSDPLRFNNSDPPRFENLLQCYYWHLRNTNTSYHQASEACSSHDSLLSRNWWSVYIFGLIGIFIILANVTVLFGIIGTRKLHKALYLYIANLATVDLLPGVLLLCLAFGQLSQYGVIAMLHLYTCMLFTQTMSASALSLLSIDCYIAVRHPIFFHNNASKAKRNACVAIVCSWIVLTLCVFSSSMGWNCIYDRSIAVENCIAVVPLGYAIFLASIIVFLCFVLMFTNISIFVRIKRRQKTRLRQFRGGVRTCRTRWAEARENQGRAGGNEDHDAQDKARRAHDQQKLDSSARKARTVMTLVTLAFVFWVLGFAALPFGRVCFRNRDVCSPVTFSNWVILLMLLNSALNPLANIIRMADLRNAIWQQLTGPYRGCVNCLRRFGREQTGQEQNGPAPRNGQNNQATETRLYRSRQCVQSASENCV
ncbi:sphingosine 1-phosphate receptor 1-like [Branchiostoma floridae x Branchiostoma belcheri]